MDLEPNAGLSPPSGMLPVDASACLTRRQGLLGSAQHKLDATCRTETRLYSRCTAPKPAVRCFGPAGEMPPNFAELHKGPDNDRTESHNTTWR